MQRETMELRREWMCFSKEKLTYEMDKMKKERHETNPKEKLKSKSPKMVEFSHIFDSISDLSDSDD